MTFDEWCAMVAARRFAFDWKPSMAGPEVPMLKVNGTGETVAAGRWTYWLKVNRGIIDLDAGTVEGMIFEVGHSDPEEAIRMAGRLEVELP